MNQDESLPWKRSAGLWTSLYKAGDIDRAFDPKLFAALRMICRASNFWIGRTTIYKQGHWEKGVQGRRLLP